MWVPWLSFSFSFDSFGNFGFRICVFSGLVMDLLPCRPRAPSPWFPSDIGQKCTAGPKSPETCFLQNSTGLWTLPALTHLHWLTSIPQNCNVHELYIRRAQVHAQNAVKLTQHGHQRLHGLESKDFLQFLSSSLRQKFLSIQFQIEAHLMFPYTVCILYRNKNWKSSSTSH